MKRILMLMFGVVFFLSALPAIAQTNAGDTNPIRNPMLFQDDELLMGYFHRSTTSPLVAEEFTYLKVPTSDDLSTWTQTTKSRTLSSTSYNFDGGVAASGRIADPLHDQVVRLMMRNGGQLSIELLDPVAGYNAPVKSSLVPGNIPWNRVELMAVAVGDLDFLVDDNGMFHDEIVVVHATPDAQYQSVVRVDVFDYNLTLLATFSVPYHTDGSLESTVSLGDGVAVTLGDFDGDGVMEIAIAKRAWSTMVEIQVGRLLYDGTAYNLQFPGPLFSVQWSGYPYNGIDLKSGDFAGTGKVGLALSTGLYIYIFETDSSLKLIQKAQTRILLSSGEPRDGYGASIRIEPGLFRYDPVAGYDINRTQIAYYFGSCPTHRAGIIELGTDMVLRQLSYSEWVDTNCTNSPYTCVGTLECTTNQTRTKTQLAVGNFVGHGQSGEATSPTMQIAVAATKSQSTSPYGCALASWRFWKVSPDAKTLTQVSAQSGSEACSGVRNYFLLATDSNGDTWRLGPPIHMSVDKLTQLKLAIQEPPKHVDYLPLDPESDLPESAWVWGIINVNATKADFNVAMGVTSNHSMTTSNTSESSSSVGGGGSLDYDATISAGFLDIARVTTSYGASIKAAYQYESSKSEIDSNYTELTKTEEVIANLDDYLQGKMQNIDIWLYPIVGYMTGDPAYPNGYYQVVVPGIEYPFTGAAKNISAYQPVHENHNVFSYPFFNNENGHLWTPPDLGSFIITSTNTAVTDIMNDQESVILGGVTTNMSMEFTQKAGQEKTKSYSKTLTTDIDMYVGSKAEVKFFARGDVSWKAKFNLDKKQSWGSSQVAKQETSSTSGLTISSTPLKDDTKGYGFSTAAYVTDGGVFKVAHAIDPGSFTNWWRVQYGRKPDPALNLPHRLLLNTGVPEDYYTLQTDDTRHDMRGFFLREGMVNPVTGKHELLSGIPTDGDIVQLCVRVYNYSFVDILGSFSVKFSYFPWDSAGAMQTGAQISQPQMKAWVSDLPGFINGQNMKEVCVDWDTTGLSNIEPPTDGYRFEVRLDEENYIDEIHEGWQDPGCTVEVPGTNNTGRFPWNNAILVGLPTVPQAKPEGPAKPTLLEDSLAIETKNGLQSRGKIFLEPGKKYRLRLHVKNEATKPHDFFGLFYDGNPKHGGKLISLKLARGLPTGDGYIWTNWTPDTKGKHEIWAHVIGDLRHEDRQESWDSLDVVVTPPQAVKHASSGKGK